MKLQRLHITGFGKLAGREFQLSPGFNVFWGPNESGKSTLQAFIRAMLYGLKMPDARRRQWRYEFEKYVPWSGASYGGVIEFCNEDGKLYRVERSFARDNERTRIYDGVTGQDLTDSFKMDARRETLFAEQFTGMNELVFTNVACIGDIPDAATDKGYRELAARLANLEESGDEATSARRAMELLGTSQRESAKRLREATQRETNAATSWLALQARRDEVRTIETQLALMQAEAAAQLPQVIDAHTLEARLREQRKRLAEELSLLAAAQGELGIAQADLQRYAFLAELPTDSPGMLVELGMIEKETVRLSAAIDAVKQRLDTIAEQEAREAAARAQAFSAAKEVARLISGRQELSERKHALQLVATAGAVGLAKAEHLLAEEAELREKVSKTAQAAEMVPLLPRLSKTGLLLVTIGIIIAVAGYIQSLPALIQLGAIVPALIGLFYLRNTAQAARRAISEREKLFTAKREALGAAERISSQLRALLATVRQPSVHAWSSAWQQLNELQTELADIEHRLRFTEEQEIAASQAALQARTMIEVTMSGVCEGGQGVQPQDALHNLTQAWISHLSELQNRLLSLVGTSTVPQDTALLAAATRDASSAAVNTWATQDGVSAGAGLGTMADMARSLQDEADAAICRLVQAARVEDTQGFGQVWAKWGQTRQAAKDKEQAVERSQASLQSVWTSIHALLANEASAFLKAIDIPAPPLPSFSGDEAEVLGALAVWLTAITDGVARLRHLEETRTRLETELALHYQELAGETGLAAELASAKAERTNAEESLRTLQLAQSELAQSVEEMHRQFAPALNDRASEALNRITQGRYSRLNISNTLQIKLTDPEFDRQVDLAAVSSGTCDQVYLAFRLAAAQSICGGMPAPPLLLDDAFARYDDARAEVALAAMLQLSLTSQVLFFTCRSRELSILRDLTARTGIDHALHIL